LFSSIGLWVSLGLAIVGTLESFCIIFFPSFHCLLTCISSFYVLLFLHLRLIIYCCRIELNGWCKYFYRIKRIISSFQKLWKFIVIIELLGLVFLFSNLDCWPSFLAKNNKFMLFLEHAKKLQLNLFHLH